MQPPVYNMIKDFSSAEANSESGRSTVSTAALDAELINIQSSLNPAILNLGLIQRDDGNLRDGIVRSYNLSADAVLFLNAQLVLRGNWVASTIYLARDFVNVSGSSYIAVSAHTSAALFATDLTDGKWILVATPAPVESVALVASGSAANVSQVVISGLSVTYFKYVLEYDNLVVDSGNQGRLMMRTSTDNGASFASSEYQHMEFSTLQSQGGMIFAGGDTKAEFPVAGPPTVIRKSTTADPANGTIQILDPATLGKTKVRARAGFVSGSIVAEYTYSDMEGRRQVAEINNAFRLYGNSAVGGDVNIISMTWRLYGYRR